MILRDAVPEDWSAIWPVLRDTIAAGETYALPEDLTVETGRQWWMTGSVVVAERDGVLLGTAKHGPNRPGRGAHVGTASFLVAERARGLGVGRALGEHVLERLRADGFSAVQFNAVVETNVVAVALWRSLGFEVVGTVPGAYDSRAHGRVGLHVMHRLL